jgi:serine/threonine protein phosphatase PrpC
MLPLLVSHPEMTSEDLRKLLVEGVQRANQAVYQHNMEQRADMGTTMTAALIVDTIAYVANVGDSRTYLYREPYGLVKITRDHSVVASLVDQGIIKPDDIYTHPKLDQIYRSLGEKPVVEVDSFQQERIPNDKLLLCSDGLWKMVRDPQIAAVLKQQNPDPGMTGDGLIQAALAGGGEENVSVIVVEIIEPSGDRHGLQLGVQLLAKPDTLNMPSVPQLQ